MSKPSLFTGPIVPDLVKAAGAGASLGGVVGFVLASMRYSLTIKDMQKILLWSTYSGMLAAVFAVALVLFGRLY